MTHAEGERAVAEPESTPQPIDDPDELLFRQVHPNWIVDGIPSSQTFNPTKKDEGKLSIALGSKTDAEGAYRHHVEVRRLASVGTWAVAVGEASRAGRQAFPEPLDNDPAHGFVDFRGISRGDAEKAAKVLLSYARARGCLYSPEQAHDRMARPSGSPPPSLSPSPSPTQGH